MAVTKHPTVREVGEALAERASQEPLVRELWAYEGELGVHLWVLIDPIDDYGAQRELYKMYDVLWERFPDGGFLIHVINPRDYKRDPHNSLEHDAVQIPLRTR
jgi:hypothetical protein